jgi:(E)-4-hydroxy-3-methylbut-2-enyl-diphosphate synthase
MRWKTSVVKVGAVGIGGGNPVRIQSMTTSNTRDVKATVDQILKLQDVGCEIVRVTVQGKKEAEACGEIKNELLKIGCNIPIVADIHFYPPAAMLVADFVDKIRINPGNFVDTRAIFKKKEYTDDEYSKEILKIEEGFSPLVEKCKRRGIAMRIGTNHGSLSDRIMNRYGDTPLGMVESAFEFARVARKYDYHNFLFSMKASNPLVMVDAYRLLVKEMLQLGWNYPLHLGVTEAGLGEDGRIKSAVGIGSLLLEGLGDTIRVSLTEDPWDEIDPCKRLIRFANEKAKVRLPTESIERRKRKAIISNEFEHPVTLSGKDQKTWKIEEGAKHILLEDFTREFFDWYKEQKIDLPVILKAKYDLPQEDLVILASMELGSYLIDGLGDGVQIIAPNQTKELEKNLLQACRMLSFKTDFIACPGCGRTLFDLKAVTNRIKEKTGHIPDLKIAIMGCIVNGPGEMADADFGYVGSKPGKIDLYVGKTCVEKNIDFNDAESKLIDLIKAHGKWVEKSPS